MISETRTDLDFKWEDEEIMNVLLKRFDDIHPYSNDPKEFLDNRDYLKNINDNIRKMNRREIKEKTFF